MNKYICKTCGSVDICLSVWARQEDGGFHYIAVIDGDSVCYCNDCNDMRVYELNDDVDNNK